MVKDLPTTWTDGSIPGLRRSLGEGNGYPLQYSCLENSVDRGAWQATIHGVAESDTIEQLILPGDSVVKKPPANAEDTGSIPRLRRSPGEGNGNPIQYSCLENSMERGVWWATVQRDTELDMTYLLNTCTHTHTLLTNSRKHA